MHIPLSICPPALVPIDMKCHSQASTPPQQVQMTLENSQSNNLSNNRPSSIAGIAGDELAQINPTPIIQQPTNNIAGQMTHATSPEQLHKSPTTASQSSQATSTGAAAAISCGSCSQPICDRYIMKVVDMPYHERCLQCVSCFATLTSTCYQRNNKLYCRIDYERWVRDFNWKILSSTLRCGSFSLCNENLQPFYIYTESCAHKKSDTKEKKWRIYANFHYIHFSPQQPEEEKVFFSFVTQRALARRRPWQQL